MNLSKQNLAQIQLTGLDIPRQEIFSLPEKILQFGTGVLLRALPDYFVDKANRRGIFNGRILLAKSTGAGEMDAFNKQDGLYSLSIRGMEAGVPVDQHIICSAISRVLSAGSQWAEILKSAANSELQIVISNTTEVGIQLVKESILQKPPASFPAKLLAFLFERYKIFKGSPEAGMLIIPTELLTDNGIILKSILTELAEINKLDQSFIGWLVKHNRFCSSLVDRIVPGKPDSFTKEQLEKGWGYEDELMAVCEPYRLWAIEGEFHDTQMVRRIGSLRSDVASGVRARATGCRQNDGVEGGTAFRREEQRAGDTGSCCGDRRKDYCRWRESSGPCRCRSD